MILGGVRNRGRSGAAGVREPLWSSRPWTLRRVAEFGGLACLVLLPSLSAWASTVLIAGQVPVRLLAAVFIVFALLANQVIPRVGQVLVVVALVWGAAGVALLAPGVGVNELMGVAVGLLTCLSVVLVMQRRSWLNWLLRGWLLAAFVVNLPGLYEVVTGRHMPNYLLGSAAYIRTSATDIASFMVNPNLYAYFLVASLIVLIVGWRIERGPIRLLYVMWIVITPALVWLTASRISAAVMLVPLVWCLVLSRPLMKVAMWLAIAGGVGAVVLNLFPRIENLGMQFLVDLGTTSGQQRSHLYQDAMHLFVQSWGLGIGPAEFNVRAKGAPYDTFGLFDPHSGVTEVFVQYGALVGALVVGVALAGLTWAWKRVMRRHVNETSAVLLQAIIVTIVVMLPLAFNNSSYLKSPMVWAQAVTVAAFAHWLISFASDLRRPQLNGTFFGVQPRPVVPRRARLVRQLMTRQRRDEALAASTAAGSP